MVVLDASTGILLAKVELLDTFLQDIGPGVIMPREVREECRGRDSLDAWLIARALDEKRISATAARPGAIRQLAADFGLGGGEAAAIALAAARETALVATDDRRAINACKVLKIPFATAISVLSRMFEKGLLNRQEALEKLGSLARHGRHKKEIVAAARAELEK
jgi:predicted nucleic acid-binding protein